MWQDWRANMSQAPSPRDIQQTATTTLEKQIQFLDVQEHTQTYFEQRKNPKIFLFYLYLVNIHLYRENKKIYFNIQEATYKYDVSDKTIKIWLKELEALQLIKFNFRKNQLFFLQVLDYRQSKIFYTQQENTQTDRSNTDTSIVHYPNRFFKDIQLILRNIAKESNKESKVFAFHNDLWILKEQKSKACLDNKSIAIEFQSLTDTNISVTLPYWFIAQTINQTPPPITNPYHQNIFKSQIKRALNQLEYQGEYYEKIA